MGVHGRVIAMDVRTMLNVTRTIPVRQCEYSAQRRLAPRNRGQSRNNSFVHPDKTVPGSQALSGSDPDFRRVGSTSRYIQGCSPVRVLLVAAHPRLHQRVLDRYTLRSHGLYAATSSDIFAVDPVALGTVGQHSRLPVQLVVLRQVEARVVGLPDVRAVEELEERVAFAHTALIQPMRHICSCPALPILSRSGHFCLMKSIRTPIAFMLLCHSSSTSRSRVDGVEAIDERQRLAVGQIAPAVAILVDVTEAVEQRPRRRRIVGRRDVQRVVVARNVRRNRLRRRQRLALVDDADQLRRVERHRDRAAQRDLVAACSRRRPDPPC